MREHGTLAHQSVPHDIQDAPNQAMRGVENIGLKHGDEAWIRALQYDFSIPWAYDIASEQKINQRKT